MANWTDEQAREACARHLLAITSEIQELAVGRALLTLEAKLKTRTNERDRLTRERAAALNVTTREGLTASEWLLRTGLAEAERDAMRPVVEAALEFWKGMNVSSLHGTEALLAAVATYRARVAAPEGEK